MTILYAVLSYHEKDCHMSSPKENHSRNLYHVILKRSDEKVSFFCMGFLLGWGSDYFGPTTPFSFSFSFSQFPL